jgi:diguanylate cyclase (GGDEF)-like protein
VLVLVLTFSAALQAQQYVFRPFRQAEGLKNLAVNGVVADHHGFLWVATENGVYRLLGSSFERFGPEQGIAELNVRTVLVAPDDTVWAATFGNLYRWDGHRFVAAASQPIPVASWNGIVVEDAHHLLIVDRHRLYRLENDGQGRMISFRPVFSDSQLKAMPDLAGVSSVSMVHDALTGIQIWIGCGKELYSWSERDAGSQGQLPNGKIVEWGPEQGIAGDVWEGVFLDHAGTLWAGARNHVAVLLRQPGSSLAGSSQAGSSQAGFSQAGSRQAGSSQLRKFQDRSIPFSGAYAHAPFAEDRENRVLAPSEDGIARWDGKGWQFIGRANGLEVTGNVVSMIFDASGDAWIATRGGGVFDWVGYENWEGWNDTATLPSTVAWSINPPSDNRAQGNLNLDNRARDNRVFLGTDKGPAWIDPRTGKSGSLSPLHPWPFGQLFTVGTNPDGTLWGGTDSGAVLHIDPKTGKTEQTAKLPTLVTRSVSDRSGHIFFTTDDGIYVRDSARTMAAPTRETAADRVLGSSTQVNAGCASADGGVWFMTTSRLIRFLNGRWTVPAIHGKFGSPGILLDLACTADGSVWITGQQTGTWRIKTGKDGAGTDGAGTDVIDAWQLNLPTEFQALTPVAIAVDHRGWVWLGTDSGLLVWNGQEWRQLTQESGLLWNDVNQGAMTFAADGTLWIGTSGGIAHLLHPERAFDPVPLSAVVTRIRRGDQVISDRDGPVGDGIQLPWSDLPLSIQLSSPAMRNRSQLVFEYRMDGLHSDWIESRDGNAVFSGLPPGKYAFIAMARNLGLNSYSPVIKIQVRIFPPWWKTWWFLTLCVLAFFLVIVAISWLHERHLLERSRELEFQVKKRTLELEKRITEVRVAEEKIKKLAFYDPLTHLPNRRLLTDRLTQTIDASTYSKNKGALLFIDIDNFKALNDALGHKTGDLLLQEVARRLSSCVGEGNTVARLGGDEFVAILAELSRHPEEAADQARMVAENILDLVCQTYNFDGRECQSTSSIGITVIGEKPESIDDVLQRADLAMYQAKENGGRCMHFFDPALLAAMNSRALMESDIRKAIKADQFVLYYQPQLEAGRLVGAEALIRWQHPRRGVLGPGQFISLAEETGLILPLGDWVLGTACRQIAAWAKQERTRHLTLAVNISARQLREPDFVTRVLAAVERTGADPRHLKLELTESMLVDNIESVIAKMTQIKAKGIGLSLDDFGTGYSSLSYLKRLPLDQLKIDRSFVRDIVEDLSSRAIAQSVISLGQVMNRSVIAEGVETEEQLVCLRELGCHAFQGFLFGSPLPLDEFELLIPIFNDLIPKLPAAEVSEELDQIAPDLPEALLPQS